MVGGNQPYGRGRFFRPLAMTVAMLPVVAVAAVTAPRQAEAADSWDSPFVLQPGAGPFSQYGYAPAYTRNVPAFDGRNRAYIRSRTSDTDHTSYIHVLESGRWTKLDFRGALQAAFPTFVETVNAAGAYSEKIIFDRHDRAYNPLTIRLRDGSTRNVLMVSSDACRSWRAFELPAGGFVIEQWVGHNELEGPPFLAYWRPTAGTTPRGQRNTLWVTQPRLEGDSLVIPTPRQVTRNCLGLRIGAGTGSFAVTQGGITTFAWVEATRAGQRTTPEFVATYDHATATVSKPVLLAQAPGVNDIHNVPSLCSDSQGYLHFAAGTHGTPVLYARSLEPYSAASWTRIKPVLSDGYAVDPLFPDVQTGRQTYNSFLCDANDTLHLVTRQWRRGVDPYHQGAAYGALVHQSHNVESGWSPPTIVAVAAEPGYGLFNHKLALDQRNRLFLSLSYVGGTELAEHRERVARMQKLGKAVPNLGRYRRRMLLVSADSGASWRLALDEDLAAPGQAVPERPTDSHAGSAAPVPPVEVLWSWQRPLPQGNQLADVDFVSGSVGWAVGTFGTILRSTNGGRTWRLQASATRRDLLAVSAVNSRTAWAVGEGGEILRTVDGGRTWLARGIEGGRTLLGVHAISAVSACAVGFAGEILLTTDGGRRWTRRASRTSDSLFSVTFVNRKLGWACSSKGRIIVSRNGGRTWSNQQRRVSAALHSIAFFDGACGVAAGDGGALIYTRDGGSTWRSGSLPRAPAVRAVEMVSRSRVYAVGEGGAFLVSVDGGRSWRRRQLPWIGMTGGLAAQPAGRVWAGGVGGVTVRSVDFGRHWSGVEPGLTIALHAVAAGNAGLVAAGSRGRMLFSGNGVSWRSVATGSTAHLRAAAMNGAAGWAVGDSGTVLKSVDAGQNWRRLAPPVALRLHDVAASTDGGLWLVGDKGTLLSSRDEGETWASHAVTTDPLHCVAFRGELGWVGGGDALGDERATLLRTADGGLTWQEVELPIWGALSALEFIDSSRGWAAAVDWGQDGDVRSGAILATTDGGLTWSVQARAPEALTALQMAGDGSGWAFGESGMALQAASGGSIWATRHVGTTSTLRGAAASAGVAVVVGDGGAVIRGAIPAAEAVASRSD